MQITTRRATHVVCAADGEEFDPRTFRRNLVRSEKYNRRVSGDESAVNEMKDQGIWTTNDGAFVLIYNVWSGGIRFIF